MLEAEAEAKVNFALENFNFELDFDFEHEPGPELREKSRGKHEKNTFPFLIRLDFNSFKPRSSQSPSIRRQNHC